MAGLIDANYLAAKGHYPETSAADRLFHQWRNEAFQQLVDEIQAIEEPELTDVLFLLYDLAGAGADDVIKVIERTRKATLRDGKMHSASFPFPLHSSGITFVSYPATSTHIEQHFPSLAVAKKYQSRADEWLVLGSRSTGPQSFDMLWYSKEPWQRDSNAEALANALLTPGRAITPDGRKLGRNARCPCGSGLKFKRCHGK